MTIVISDMQMIGAITLHFTDKWDVEHRVFIGNHFNFIHAWDK